jgi:hypothetical protein
MKAISFKHPIRKSRIIKMWQLITKKWLFVQRNVCELHFLCYIRIRNIDRKHYKDWDIKRWWENYISFLFTPLISSITVLQPLFDDIWLFALHDELRTLTFIILFVIFIVFHFLFVFILWNIQILILIGIINLEIYFCIFKVTKE